MPISRYGVLLVSFSRHSHQKSFVPIYQKHPRAQIIAVADEPDIEPELKSHNQQMALDLGVPYIEGVDEALARSDVNIVSIGHEIERRADLIIRAAQAGKHIWIDKFIGANIDECDAVVEQVESSGVTNIVPSFVYSELVTRGLDLINTGELGSLMGVHADLMFGKSIPRPIQDRQEAFLPPGRWKFDDIKRELLTVGSYAVGLIQSCLGPITHVHGQGDAYFFPEHAAHGAEDFGTITMTDQHGRIATISGSRVGNGTHPYGGTSSAYLVGTNGTARVDGTRPLVDTHLRETIIQADYTVQDHDPMQWASSAPVQGVKLGEDPLSLGFEDFIIAIDEGKSPKYTVREVRDLMEILFAGYQSIVSEDIITLPIRREGHSAK